MTKTRLSIIDMHGVGLSGKRKVVAFSDGKKYESIAIDKGAAGWDCELCLKSSGRTVTSPLRRRMVLDYLGLQAAVVSTDKTRVNNLRRNLRKYGLEISKSSSRYPNPANRGGYKVTNGDGVAVIGPHYDATLAQVEELLAAKSVEFRVE